MLPGGALVRASRAPTAGASHVCARACLPAQFPFALPQVPPFREITRTQGVDQYTLNYHDYCHGRGSATQITADSIDALGIDPRSENLLAPSAAILRSAEAVDSILNAATSGSPEVENSMNAGRILCSSKPRASPTRATPTTHRPHARPLAPNARIAVPRTQFASWAG